MGRAEWTAERVRAERPEVPVYDVADRRENCVGRITSADAGVAVVLLVGSGGMHCIFDWGQIAGALNASRPLTI